METDKKHQHYIWKNYLKPWAINNTIWCKRHNSIFNVSLNNIAHEKYFYELKPLNEIELKIVTNFIKKTPIENQKLLIKLLAQYFYIGNSPDENLRKNGIEEYHSRIEQSAIPLLEFIYKKDLSFLNDTDNKVNFFYFVSLQYHRTKCMLENVLTGLNHLPVRPPPEIEGKFSNENIVKAFSILFAECSANWMYEKAKIYFIETDYEFIASDQPIINIHSNNSITFEPVKETEYYYPVTPHLAIFITAKDFDNIKIGKTEADKYNKLLYGKSHEQIYASSRELLNQYC
jgi:hypothetical protein